jgi:arylsulfatase A-like enzyme
VIKALKESGQLDNTLVVYSADQGFSMGEHGCRSKIAPYDANYASPLIVSMSKTLPTGKVCPHPVNAPDLVVTFFKFAGIELPWTMHGRDITSLLRKPDTALWHSVLYEHTGHDYGSDVTRILKEKGKADHSNVPWYVAIRDGKYKYIRYLGVEEMEEVYDLKADPEELTNLALKPENTKLLATLRQSAIVELRRTEATFIDHMSATRTK